MNDCTGSAALFKFCDSPTNDCNGGAGSSLLGSGFLNGAISTAYNACETLNVGAGNFGKTNWRVPLSTELKVLIECIDKTLPVGWYHCGAGNFSYSGPAISSLFPTPYDTVGYWTSTSEDTSNAMFIGFANGILYPKSKTMDNHVRCVAGP